MKMNNSDKSSINVELLRENSDGSAVYTFDFTPEMQEALLRFGIIKAIEMGLEEAKKLHPDFKDE